MAEGGYDAEMEDPFGRNEGDDDDDEEVDTTRPFHPGSASTPYRGGEEIPMRTNLQDTSGLPATSYDESYWRIDDIPSLVGFTHQDDKPALLARAKDFMKKRFPRVDFGKMGPTGFSKKPGNETTIVSLGSKGGETEFFKKDGSGLLKKFTDKFKTSLGPEAESLIANDNEEIRETRQSLREAEKQLKEAERINIQKEKAAQEAKNLRIRLEQTQAKIDQYGESNVENESELRRLVQLKKNLQTEFENKEKQVAALEKQSKQQAKQIAQEKSRIGQIRASLQDKESKRDDLERGLYDTKPIDDMKEREAEIQRQNEQD